jgi:hypothetical protein
MYVEWPKIAWKADATLQFVSLVALIDDKPHSMPVNTYMHHQFMRV